MPPSQQHPLALAIEWVTKITTVALEMVLPGLFGLWLDRRWGVQFLAIAGFAVGGIAGFWHLLKMTAVRGSQANRKTSGKPPPDSPSSDRQTSDRKHL